MKKNVQTHIFDVWWVVVDGFKEPTTPLIDKDVNKLEENDWRDGNVILNGLTKSIHLKFMQYESTQGIWNKLQNIYEGDSKVEGAKLQTLRSKFKQLNMKEDEDIEAYFIQFNEVMNGIIGLGDEMKENVVVQKLIISLPMRFDSKISTLE
jgi:hypothetical protein